MIFPPFRHYTLNRRNTQLACKNNYITLGRTQLRPLYGKENHQASRLAPWVDELKRPSYDVLLIAVIA